tara:strand:- start:40551 stop:41003 length:453 start_codon:yes stop_codon:yes gene_type:complete
MNTKDTTRGSVIESSIPLLQRAVASAVTVGAAINVTGVQAILHTIKASAVAALTVGIQDVQFANDAGFTTNVSTYTTDDYLNSNDQDSASSAIVQTLLAAAGSSKLSLVNLAKNGQEFMRVRAVQPAGTPDATFGIETLLVYGSEPKIQS